MPAAYYFNSRPHEEVDHTFSSVGASDSIFQLTTSRGGRLQSSSFRCSSFEYFNSRPHEEVDWLACVLAYYVYISTHDLTRRSTVYIQVLQEDREFQLTTSRGGRPIDSVLYGDNKYFNSRPHEEVDLINTNYDANIDTFQLTTSRGGRRLSILL